MRSRLPIGALIGLLAAGAAVAAGELFAAFVRPAASPIIAVGNRFILLTPEWLKRRAIKVFGTNDKPALLTGIYVMIIALAVVVGVLALRRLVLGIAGLTFFGLVGVYSALTAHAHRGSDVIPSLLATVVGVAVLIALVRVATGGSASAAGVLLPDRRQFLQGTAATAGLAVAGGLAGRAISHHRFDASKARAAVVLPKAAEPAPALPNGADLGKGAEPFVTANDDFYRIDTALTVPQLDPKTWRLRIHGLVEREITLTYDQLIARPLIERWVTLTCVSNEIGGRLISNAKFLGIRLADLLKEAGVRADADQLVARSSDGMTIGSPTSVVLDGRDAMLAIGMNDDPLPIEHGFPVRMVVPGLYGYVSACKWIVDIEATRFSDRDAYWVRSGWAAHPPIQLESRIDTPRSADAVAVGSTVPVAGVAWDQHVGVSKVEVQVDSGEWQQARLAPVPSADTWRQWVYPWTVPSAGDHTLRVRATDAAGNVQTTTRTDPYPSGATGLHQITVNARKQG